MTKNSSRPLKLYLLRHGQTEHSRDNYFCGSGTNPPLTAQGLTMAEEFAAAYRTQTWEQIFSSPLERARQTLAPLLREQGVSAEYRAELAEISYGAWEGLTPLEIERDTAGLYSNWLKDPVSYSPPGGESALQLAERASQLLAEIQTQHQSGDILIVSHKGTIRALLCHLLGIDLKLFRARLDCPVCSLSIIEYRPAGPLLRALGDRRHLSSKNLTE